MIHTLLKGKKVVLASASPRRRQIFKQLGLKTLHKIANIDESINTNNPRKYVLEMSKQKARKVAEAMDEDSIVVAADTVVFIDREILSKPSNRFQAADYLTRLSGKTHFVYTGICVYYKRKCVCDYAKTAVTFNTLSAKEISEYLDTSEPDDKAGAYGIQGYGCQFISKICGCYFNVMGFPVAKFYQLLTDKMLNNTNIDITKVG